MWGYTFFQKHGRHHDLPDRAWRINALNPSVQQRISRVIAQGFPVTRGQPPDKNIVVIGRLGHESSQLSVFRFHNDHTTGIFPHGVHNGILQTGIQCERDVLPADGIFFLSSRKGTSQCVHFLAEQALFSSQTGFQHTFQALTADCVTESQTAVFLQFLYARFSDITEDMSEGRPLSIVPQRSGNHLKAGPVDEFRLNTGNFFKGYVRKQDYRIKLSSFHPFLLVSACHLFKGNFKPGAYLSKCCGDIITILSGQCQSKGWPVFRQQNTRSNHEFPHGKQKSLPPAADYPAPPLHILRLYVSEGTRIARKIP